MQQSTDTPVTKLLPARTKSEPGSVKRGKSKSFADLQPGLENIHKVNDLNPEQQNLFNFLKLVVDIKYRHRYGEKIEQNNGKGYSTYGD
ncbi:MAG TPA: hypothetical protein VMQ52_01725 [Candidatus Saccharimonadales bacterium]|nr:hypothetical protein [Candidatus Saccharimonadales bacterium]